MLSTRQLTYLLFISLVLFTMLSTRQLTYLLFISLVLPLRGCVSVFSSSFPLLKCLDGSIHSRELTDFVVIFFETTQYISPNSAYSDLDLDLLFELPLFDLFADLDLDLDLFFIDLLSDFDFSDLDLDFDFSLIDLLFDDLLWRARRRRPSAWRTLPLP